MSPTDDGSSARAHEIQVVLDQCVDRLAEGESVTKEQVIAAHPALMPELGDELRKLSLIERAQRRARDAGSSSGIGATVEAKGEPWIKDGDTIPATGSSASCTAAGRASCMRRSRSPRGGRSRLR
jgi:hypothetical protein